MNRDTFGKNFMHEGEGSGLTESFHYRSNQKELIDPFLTHLDAGTKMHFSLSIAFILDISDDQMLEKLEKSNEYAVIFIESITDVEKLLSGTHISPNAPWLDKLRKKMLGFKIYQANTEAVMDIEQGKIDSDDRPKAALNKVRKLLEDIRREQSSGSSTNNELN